MLLCMIVGWLIVVEFLVKVFFHRRMTHRRIHWLCSDPFFGWIQWLRSYGAQGHN